MDDQWIESLQARIVRIEEKVDSLLSFRSWVLGVGAAVSTIVSLAVTWLTSK